jgi:hypothetical protein
VPAYDTSFNPPAPVADVTVAHPVTAVSSGTLRGKLDSGADVTVIPARLVVPLNITPRGHIWTRGYDGTYARRLVYYVQLTVEGFALPSVRCIATDRTNVLLGRNVLNRFIVTLDGKNLILALQDP